MTPVASLRQILRRIRLSEKPSAQWTYRTLRSTYRFVGRRLWFLGLGWVDSVQVLTRDGDGWRVEGWAYHRGVDLGPDPQIRAWLRVRWRRVEIPASSVFDLQARATARAAEHDYARNGFSLRVGDDVLESLPLRARARLRVRIDGGGHRVRGAVRRVANAGSAAVASLRLEGDHLVGPLVDDRSRLRFTRCDLGPVANSIRIGPDGIEVTVDGRPHEAWWAGVDQDRVSAAITPEGSTSTLSAPAPTWVQAEAGPRHPVQAWRLETGGRRHPVPVVMTEQTAVVRDPDQPWFVRIGLRHEVELVRAATLLVVEAAEFSHDAPRIDLRGRWSGAPDFDLFLRSNSVGLPVELTTHEDGTFEASVALDVSRWGGATRPAPRGSYTLLVGSGHELAPALLDERLGATLPRTFPTDDYRLRFLARRGGRFSVTVGPPRTVEEFGSWQQLRMRAQYMSGSVEPVDAVYFESFFGRNATCNPAAIDAEMAVRHPDVPRYWGVMDLSIEVPEGSIPVVRGTAEWWRVRSTSRWIVVNEWLRGNFVKQPFQTVMQTWHGSMYKQIGLDRGALGKAHLTVVDRERQQWDLFLSQAPETTPIIRRAYDLDEQVIETGYPRNGELRTTTPQRRAELRARIGIPEGSTVVMYAPTWRETVQEGVELLDLTHLSHVLGDEFIFLQRGHVRSLDLLNDASDRHVIDVSTYPQVNHLQEVADVLITDYSSMMFDYSVTGRPMIFYTPDIDDYTDTKVRGSYFDLAERAPGPVTREFTEVVRLLRTLSDWPGDWAERYEAWQQRYNVLDDGHATTRAVDALLAFTPAGTQGHPHEEYVETEDIVSSETEGPAPEASSLDSDDPDTGTDT